MGARGLSTSPSHPVLVVTQTADFYQYVEENKIQPFLLSQGFKAGEELNLETLKTSLPEILLAKPLVLDCIVNEAGDRIVGLHVTCLNW